MSNYMPSKNIVKNQVKPQTTPITQTVAHDGDGLAFGSTFLLQITHAYGDTPTVVVENEEHRNKSVVSVERTNNNVNIEFTELVTGVCTFDDLTTTIHVDLQPHLTNIAHQ